MQTRTKRIHFLVSPEEEAQIHMKMSELGIRNRNAYLRKMALDGYCIKLELQDVKELVSLLRRCNNNLNQYAKRANETGSIYAADVHDLQNRLDEIWAEMKEVLVHLSSIQQLIIYGCGRVFCRGLSFLHHCVSMIFPVECRQEERSADYDVDFENYFISSVTGYHVFTFAG